MVVSFVHDIRILTLRIEFVGDRDDDYHALLRIFEIPTAIVT